MKDALISILSCPLCRGSLMGNHERGPEDSQSEGNLVCRQCTATYPFQQGIPRLYLGDDSVIERSDQSKHSEYILDPKRIAVLAGRTRKRSSEPNRGLFYNRISVLAIMGWMLVALTGVLVLFGLIESEIPPVYWVSLAAVALAAGVLFVLDFRLYRKAAAETYEYQVNRLNELSWSSVLSEFDIQQKRQDKSKEIFDLTEDQPKAEEIARKLERYGASGKTGLNIGCGGEQHQLIARPFFDRGYELVGVDISEEYLLEYSRLFKASAVQANALSLPFKDDTFDVVNFCDVLEHLHHPFLGLCEVHRVLKNGGLVILTTNYRCRLSRKCANPLILAERVISLYFDGVLGPRDMLRRFSDMEFYHLDFSRREITELLESAGFEILEFYTYLSKRKGLTKVINRLPVLRFMGDAIVVTSRKRVQ